MYVICFNLPRAEPVKSQICPFYVWPSRFIFEFYGCQIFIQTKFPNMDNFCFKSDVSTDFRSVTPFKGEIAQNADHLITASVSSFTASTSKKKNLTMNQQMALPGLSRCILILVFLISKCYTSGMFLLLLFIFAFVH